MKKIQYLDALTGFSNHQHFELITPEVLINSNQTDMSAVIFCVGIDRFQNINETLGHHTGNLVIKKFAKLLKKSINKNVIHARYSGDKFILLLTNLTSKKDITNVADKLLKQFEQGFNIDGKRISLTASIGIATYPYAGQTIPVLLNHAENAMLQAKSSGRNRYSFYSKIMASENKQYYTVESDIRKGLDNDHFLLNYQPIYNLHDNSLYGFESLLRWDKQILQGIPIVDVINIAEDSGLIVPIGWWIIEEAFKQYESWKKIYPQSFKLSINISPKQLDEKQWIEKITSLLAKYQLQAQDFVLELTENDVIQKIENTAALLKQTHELGFNIYIDDFGTGYSSLEYIQQLPITGLKIDKIFIDKLHLQDKGSNNVKLLKAIIAMAHSLELNIIAEGVESSSQIDILKAYENIKVQGFYYSKPLTAMQVTQLLRSLVEL